MKITINLLAGPDHREIVTEHDVQRNIEALQRAIDGKSLAADFVLLMDTKSILEGIKAKLTNRQTGEER